MTDILRRSFGLRHFDDRVVRRVLEPSDLGRLKAFAPQLSSLAGHGIRTHVGLQEHSPEVRFYTFLRKPESRALSHFSFDMVVDTSLTWEGCGYEEIRQRFFEHVVNHGNCQAKHLAGSACRDAALRTIEQDIEFVGLVECFDESLVLLRRWMDERIDIRYQARNVSASRENEPLTGSSRALRIRMMREYVGRIRQDQACMDALAEANQIDQEIYDYARSSKYLQQRFSYGKSLVADCERFKREQLEFNQKFTSKLLIAKSYRNLVLKPCRPWLFPKAA